MAERLKQGQTRWVERGETPDNFSDVFETLYPLYRTHPLESFTDIRSPFETLVSGILSSRTRDETTNEVMGRLFPEYGSPEEMLELSEDELAELIHPVGFYNQKAGYLLDSCELLIEEFDGEVPDTREELMRFKGVGRKVANLILTVVFKKDEICVDTHVHRISQRLGWQFADSPDETEQNLQKIIPEDKWKYINLLLVNHGQQICHPQSPECSKCPIEEYCPKIGVEASR